MTAGPAAGRAQITAGAHLGETGLDVGETAARERKARATGAPGGTAREETLPRPTLLAPPRMAAAKSPFPRSSPTQRGKKVVPSLTEIAFSASLLGLLIMSDDRAMPVPCSRPNDGDRFCRRRRRREKVHHGRSTGVLTPGTERRLVALPFRGVGVGFVEPHLRLVF